MAVLPKLHLSPFVLSTVMFDNSNSTGDQEGFLIGNAQKSVRREISDQSMYNTEEDLIISIYSCIPCGSYMSFYDSLGNINEKKIDEFLADRKKSVVGWYRYRRNLIAFPSSREMIIHKNLKYLFPGNISFGDEYFALGVFGSACYPSTATHTYDYTFFNQRADSFKSLNITLLNLGDTKTEYRGGSLSGSFINSSTFNSVLEIPWDFNSCWQTEDAVQQMHRMLREKCDSLAEELAASESVNSIIEQEVQKLDAELQSLTVKESVETNNNEMELENTENIPLERITLPLSAKHTKLFGKRNLHDLIDLNEELHPIYGKYFPQNRVPEPGCSFHFSGEMTGINYNFLPPKKKIKVILQERRRILDHDYDIVSDEDPPQQFVPETDEESSDTYETGGFLSSDTSGYLQEDELPSTSSKYTGNDYQKPKVKVVYLDGRAADADIHCPESVAEEIVETMIPDTPSDSEASSNPNSPADISNISEENVVSPKVGDKDDVEIKQDKGGTDASAVVKRVAGPIIIYCKPVVLKKENTPDHKD